QSGRRHLLSGDGSWLKIVRIENPDILVPNHVIRSPLLHGRVGRTRAAIRACAYSTHIGPRTTQAVAKPPRSLHEPGAQSPAPTTHRQHRVARACVPHRRHRPLKEAHNTHATTPGYVAGPPYDSVKIKSWFRLRHYKGRFMAVR